MVEKYKIYTGFLFSSFWLLACHGFIISDIAPSLQPLVNVIRLYCDIVFLLLGLISLRNRHDIFMTIMIVLLIITSKYVNHQGIIEALNGSRLYIPLMVSIPIIRYMLSSANAKRFVKSFDRQLMIFLYIQAIIIPFQFIRYGANDFVGGSFGNGGSGQVSTMIYVVSFYLLNKRWDFDKSWLANFAENKRYFFLLFPTFLNETKISFVFLFLYFLLLIKRDGKFFMRILLLSPIVAVLIVGLGYVYLNASQQDADNVLSMEYIDTYLTGGEDADELIDLAILIQDEDLIAEDHTLWALDLPRFVKLYKVRDALEDSGGGLMLGAGVGQFKGGSIIGRSHFAKKNNWLLQGSVVGLFWILIELGILGAIWIFATLIYLLRLPLPGKMGFNFKFYLTCVWGLVLIYDPQLSQIVPVFITTYVAMTGLQPESCQRITALASDNKRRG